MIKTVQISPARDSKVTTDGGTAETGGVVSPRSGIPKPKGPLLNIPEPARPAEPAPADQMSGAGKETPRRQPDMLAGWRSGGASEWGSLDLTGGGGKLPPPGNYDAVISDVELIDKPDVLWMIVSFKLVGLEASPAPILALLASRNGPVDQHRLAEGARVVNRLAAATLTPLEAITDPFELPSLFIGKPVNLTVAYKTRDGVAELVVRAIRPR